MKQRLVLNPPGLHSTARPTSPSNPRASALSNPLRGLCYEYDAEYRGYDYRLAGDWCFFHGGLSLWKQMLLLGNDLAMAKDRECTIVASSLGGWTTMGALTTTHDPRWENVRRVILFDPFVSVKRMSEQYGPTVTSIARKVGFPRPSSPGARFCWTPADLVREMLGLQCDLFNGRLAKLKGMDIRIVVTGNSVYEEANLLAHELGMAGQVLHHRGGLDTTALDKLVFGL